ncbi:MAG: hypothetical protein U1E15_11110 [Hyphomicrobiales bacterium]
MGAQYIKLETSRSNLRPGKFYERLAFHEAEDERLMYLDDSAFQTFITGA